METVKYVAVVNTPGYLPQTDESPVFDTPGDAWEYLADERRFDEDIAMDTTDETDIRFDDTLTTLDRYAQANHGPDVVYGNTPGYAGDHDLGLAYSVQAT